jgi:hypothetical protein
MRCLSPHRKYSIQVIEGEERILVDASGMAKTVQLHKPVIANFDQGGLLPYETAFVLEKFNFSGLAEGVNPLTTVSCWDIEAFVQRFPRDRRQELYVQIVQRMRELQKLNPSEFIIVEPPETPRPWPSYDEFSVEDILKFQEILRINPDEIRAYELENDQRPEIVLAMLEKSDPEAAKRFSRSLAGEDVEAEEEIKTPNFGDTTALRAALDAAETVSDEVVIEGTKPLPEGWDLPEKVIVDA